MKKSIETHLAQKAASRVTGVPPSAMGKGKHPIVNAKHGRMPPKRGARSVMGRKP